MLRSTAAPRRVGERARRAPESRDLHGRWARCLLRHAVGEIERSRRRPKEPQNKTQLLSLCVGACAARQYGAKGASVRRFPAALPTHPARRSQKPQVAEICILATVARHGDQPTWRHTWVIKLGVMPHMPRKPRNTMKVEVRGRARLETSFAHPAGVRPKRSQPWRAPKPSRRTS